MGSNLLLLVVFGREPALEAYVGGRLSCLLVRFFPMLMSCQNSGMRLFIAQPPRDQTSTLVVESKRHRPPQRAATQSCTVFLPQHLSSVLFCVPCCSSQTCLSQRATRARTTYLGHTLIGEQSDPQEVTRRIRQFYSDRQATLRSDPDNELRVSPRDMCYLPQHRY